MNPEACCSSSCCYSSLQRTVRNYSRPSSLAIRILSKLLPSFFCHNDGFFRKPTSPPLPLREGPPLSPSPFPLRGQGLGESGGALFNGKEGRGDFRKEFINTKEIRWFFESPFTINCEMMQSKSIISHHLAPFLMTCFIWHHCQIKSSYLCIVIQRE